jgi:hypothetical protein
VVMLRQRPLQTASSLHRPQVSISPENSLGDSMIVTFSLSFPESGKWRKCNYRQSDVQVGLGAIHPDSSGDGLVLSSSWPSGCLKCNIAKLAIGHAHAGRLAWPLENCEVIGSVYCFPVRQSDLIVTILFYGAIYNEFAMRGDSYTFRDFDSKAIPPQLA